MSLHVMVFNDTQDILDLFRELLTDEGYKVTLCSYGPNDIDKIESAKPDLLILDFNPLEEQSGWQLLQKIKMKRSTSGIPVVICTTQIKLAKEIEGYLTSKCIGVVFKPFDIDELLATMKKTLDNQGSTVGSIEK